MKLETVHPTLREAIALHEVLRRLGFPADDIFVALNPDSTMLIILRTQKKEVAIIAGSVPYEGEEFSVMWTDFVNAIADGQVEEEELYQNYKNSLALKLSEQLCLGLIRKGIKLPTVNRSLN